MDSVVINLIISAEELQRWYQGSAKNVSATSMDGRRVQFPVEILQSYVTHQGINGLFRIDFDEAGCFQAITTCKLS